MNIRRFFLFCVFMYLFAHVGNNGHAQSILSSKGMGMPFFHPSTRSMGLGGVSIALSDPITIPRINPAALYLINNTRISIQYFYMGNDYKDNTGSTSSYYSNLDGFSFVVPFGSGIHVSTGLTPLTRMHYDLSFPSDTLSGEPYTKSIEGRGGLNTYNFSLCWSPHSSVALGLTGYYVFGKLTEKWNVEYDNALFTPTIDQYISKPSGWGIKGGIICRPFTFITLGAVYTPRVGLDIQNVITYSYKSDTTQPGSLSMPSSWGIGAVFHIGNIAIIGLDYHEQNWSQMTINDITFGRMRDTYRLSIGSELLFTHDFNDSYIKRIAYRVGFSYEPYFYIDPEQKTLAEQWITMGLGLPLIFNVAQLDLAFGLGRRGSLETNGLSENLFRISASITGGERWFLRRY
jgi:hypothetical protein